MRQASARLVRRFRHQSLAEIADGVDRKAGEIFVAICRFPDSHHLPLKSDRRL